MPLEIGGRADKAGNKYEINCIIYEMLGVLAEKNYRVVVEAIGEDEKGTDILVVSMEGTKEHQQCKVRNASQEYWRLSDLKLRNVLSSWKDQLSRDDNRQVSLVSPIGCSFLVDLHDRALNTNGNAQDFYDYQIHESSKEFRDFYHDFCKEMGLEISDEIGVSKSIKWLKRIHFKHMSEHVIGELIRQMLDMYFVTDNKMVYNTLVSYIINGNILGKEIIFWNNK